MLEIFLSVILNLYLFQYHQSDEIYFLFLFYSMGQCASLQESTIGPNQSHSAPLFQQVPQQKPAPIIQAKSDHISSSGNINKVHIPEKNPEQTPKQISQQELKQVIFKNIKKLDFTASNYFGAMEIFDNQKCVQLLAHDYFTLMAAAYLGRGRVISVAHECVFTDFLGRDDDWIIYLRNVINWITQNKKSSPDKRIKILMTSPSPNFKLIQCLERVSIYAEIDYQCQLKQVNFFQYDCMFIKELSYKVVTQEDCKRVLEFIRKGGGLFIALRGWSYQSYGEGKDIKNWIHQSLYNKILGVMGMRFDDGCTVLNQLNLKPKQMVKLPQKQTIPYKKQDNPLFTENYKSKQKEQLIQDKKYILEGVGDCKLHGLAASSFSFSGDHIISIFKQQKNDFCIAGRFGKGKLVAYGDQNIYSRNFLQLDSQKKFLLNIVKWMCGSKPKLEMGLLHKSGQGWSQQMSFKSIGIDISIKFVEKIEDLKGIDFLCSTYYGDYPSGMTPQFNEEIKLYVEKGGNLFFASQGWVWQHYGQYQKNKELIYQNNFASYVLLKQFKIKLNRDWFGVPNPYKPITNISSRDQEIYDFLQNDFLKVLKNNVKNFSTNEQKIHPIITKINSTDPSQFQLVCSIDLYHQLVDAFISSRFNVEKHYDELPFSDPFICNVFKIMNAISYACPPHICRALPPSLNTYPGIARQRLNQKTIEVFKNRNKIVFTGLYINPGEVIKIKHNNLMEDLSDVELKVNFNSDLNKYDNGNLKRFTDISKTFKIKSKEFCIASPHGGLIYFSISSKSNDNRSFPFTFYGAYEAPYWNQNIHSYADFDKIKKIDAPFFVIETKRMNLIGPTKKILPYVNIRIEKLCNYWNTVVGHYKDYRGSEQYPFHKQAIFNDVNLIVGYMHAGNPVMTHEDLAFEMIGVGGKLFYDATWGFYHQFGHNHQDQKWTFNETVQVTCNIYSLLLIYKMHGVTVEQHMWKDSDSQEKVKNYFNNSSRSLKEYGQDPFIGLVLYSLLMQQFGYEIFSQVHKRYDKIILHQTTVEAKLDMLVEQISNVIGFNLWYYFKNWGMPVSNRSLSNLQNLKRYRCKRFPFITQN